VWLRPATKPDGYQYYEMALCYFDNILLISHDPHATLLTLATTLMLKDNKIEEPDIYHGAKLGKLDVDGVQCWSMYADWKRA
jgi:hypothetical protein